ncbi:MAG TPA: type II secretion system protein [Armatimonadota bacterium]|nr:type II secretion system protein [Armatimonadota bacterium]
MMQAKRRGGFTLIEMLVVIAIITVLAAILFPVFNRVRDKARRTKCLSKMHQIALALKQYRQDRGKYPGLPYYDATAGRYLEGLSALYPDYVDATEALVCPEDPIGKQFKGQAQDVVYCSWNGIPTSPGTDWTLTDIWYNYNGYDMIGGASGEVDSTGIDNGGVVEGVYRTVIEGAYAPSGLRWRARPRLENRSAPDNTIITHCVHHHRQAAGKANAELEHVLRMSGADGTIKRTRMEKDPDGGGAEVAPWISQLQ